MTNSIEIFTLKSSMTIDEVKHLLNNFEIKDMRYLSLVTLKHSTYHLAIDKCRMVLHLD